MSDLDALRRAEEEAFEACMVSTFDAGNLGKALELHALAVVRRAWAEHDEGLEDVYMIEGVVAKEDDMPFTEEESDAFTDAFIDWIEARGLLFGGAIGVIHKGASNG